MDNDILTKTAENGDIGARLDVFVQNMGDITRNNAQKLIDGGDVLVNNKTQKSNYRLRHGDLIELHITPPIALEILPQNIPLDIIHEDDDLIVINKPKGMVVHPAAGHYQGTLVNAVMHHCGGSLSGINGVLRPGIVHRIDKDTSGLLVVAKNDRAHNMLAEQFANHSINRKYVAIVHNRIGQDGTVNLALARHKVDRKKMAIDPNGKRAVTHYYVLENIGKFTLIKCRLETGRTHQIRVHMAHINHPILGDVVYGKSKQNFGAEGQALHARLLGFVHPNGEYMEFCVQPPLYFEGLVAKLRRI
ncbi:MAG: RluA family pseudouridine synthase [Defluviitaleaceae bacterium]|nr:RluA family pseudouridine synthase [Defluviitaleaceae bacterium]